MCGFIGEIAPGGGVDADHLERCCVVLAHRGPNEEGSFVEQKRRWGMAHRRLNILDPEGGRQPFVTPERGLTVVFNGEIYEEERLRGELSGRGWKFRSRSDTEVLLALYGVHGLDFFPYLRGEFAFALFDERRRRALLVRDRLGMKPLYYTIQDKRVLFASEIKALFQDPRVPRAFDPIGLSGCVVLADAPGRTPFQNIRQVPAAHCLTVDLDTLETKLERYWDPIGDRQRDVPRTFEEQVEAVRTAVDEAIEIRLCADVPVGVQLSGGLDSSIVTAKVAPMVDHLDAFAITCLDSKRHDELEFARAVAAEHDNVRLIEIPVGSEDTLRRLADTVWHMEKPFCNLHGVGKLMAAETMRDHGVPCGLTGDGADEAFCGYPSFWLQDALERAGDDRAAIRREMRAMKVEARATGGNRYFMTRGIGRKPRPRLLRLQEDFGFRPADLARAADNFSLLKRTFTREFRHRIHPSPLTLLGRSLNGQMPRPGEHPHAELLQYLHLTVFGPEYIAPLADRNDMAGSVEVRQPLFDHKVVELAMGLPIESKLAGAREKHVLREAYKDILPPQITRRRKQAFLLPPARFSSPLGKELLREYLNPAVVEEAGVFKPVSVRFALAVRPFMPGNKNLNFILGIMLTAQILHKQFIAGPVARKC
jgi:asparagine synthase (glutamine-hydrolysing)